MGGEVAGLLGSFIGDAFAFALCFFGSLGRELLVGVARDAADVRAVSA